MNLEEDMTKPSETAEEKKKKLESLIQMSEPFERLMENSDFQKILGFYAESSKYYATKIANLCNDLANDSDESETTINRHYRIANIISRCVVARDTLSRVATEPAQIIESAKLAHQALLEINAKAKEEIPNA